MRKILVIAAKLAVTALLLGLLVRNADVGAVGARLAQAAPWPIALGLAAYLAHFLMTAVRWRFISHQLGVRIPLGRALLLYEEAVAFNLLLPASVGGEVLRVWRTTRLFGRLRRNIAAVLFERLGSITLLTLSVGAVAAIALLDGAGPKAGGLAAILALAAALPWLLRQALRIAARWRWLRPVREVWRFGWLVRRRLFRPRALGGVVALCYLAYALAGLALAAALWATGSGGAIGPGVVAAATLAGLFGSAIPLSIAGLGFREAAMVYTLVHFGLEREAALAAAVVFTGTMFCQALPGLAIWLAGAARGRPRESAA